MLDCLGAAITAAPDVGGVGILVTSPADTPLSDVTVRGCRVTGFVNSLRVTRPGFKALPAGHEYDAATARIVVEDDTFASSHGSGIYVDGDVTDVTVRRSSVTGAGSVGLYLEAGSRGNTIEANTFTGNGFVQNGPTGQPYVVGSTTFWFWGTGREGIAVDGSRDNVIRGNAFSGDSNGGILLYKNCGEYHTQKPADWWTRRYGATGNVIEGNTFTGERTGVWVASRMAENQALMDCSDPPYVDGGGRKLYLDPASGNVIRGNRFADVRYGVRVEDDDTQVLDNAFTSSDPAAAAVIVGTKDRTEVLGEPVTGTVVRGNRSSIVGNAFPYRWIHGVVGTTFTANRSLGAGVGWCAGVQPPITPFLFVLRLQVYDPAVPLPPPPVLATVPPLAPCADPTDVPSPDPTSTTPRTSTTRTTSTTPTTPTTPSTTPAPAAAVTAVPTFTG